MCRKLLCLVTLLSIVSVAWAIDTPPESYLTVIDDFESYWGTPAMSPPWSDAGPAPSTATVQLLTAGAPYGNQAMQMNWTVAGGWVNPADPTDYTYDVGVNGFEQHSHAQAHVTFDPYNFREFSELRMTINPNHIDMMQYLIEYNSEGMFAQTWIPGVGNYGVQFWMSPDICPGIMLATGEEFPDWGGSFADDWIAKEPEINPGVWTDIAITANMVVPWSDISTLAAYDALDGFAISAWPIRVPDTSGASGDPKYYGTDEYWPHGQNSGNIGVDEIYFIITIPEPTTIALLALGALTLRRRKKH